MSNDADPHHVKGIACRDLRRIYVAWDSPLQFVLLRTHPVCRIAFCTTAASLVAVITYIHRMLEGDIRCPTVVRRTTHNVQAFAGDSFVSGALT